MTTVHVKRFMITLNCASYSTIIELHDSHKSFVFSMLFLTEAQNYACMRAQYSYLSHGYDDGITGRPTWDTTVYTVCFRQLPRTHGERNFFFQRVPTRSLSSLVGYG